MTWPFSLIIALQGLRRKRFDVHQRLLGFQCLREHLINYDLEKSSPKYFSVGYFYNFFDMLLAGNLECVIKMDNLDLT